MGFVFILVLFFFKQKTAYEMRISDWSSDVCSSDLVDLSGEAIRLGRVLTELMPDEREAVGLVALMMLTEARRPASTAPDGSMGSLADQDRSLRVRATFRQAQRPRRTGMQPNPHRHVKEPATNPTRNHTHTTPRSQR